MASKLFSPLKLGAVTLPHRVLMAPLTRCRAGEGNVPTDLMAEYYAQRASAGLIISEATTVSRFGHGYPNTPGIYTDAQVAGWKKVTQAVHAKGGRIFLQLWHVGRISHPTFQPEGVLPVGPSAIAPKGKAWTGKAMVDFVTPRALTREEIPGVVAEYVRGARLAKEAGFDGVEIHNANGYLLDQFLRSGSNQRTDEYGGDFAGRTKFLKEVVIEVRKSIPDSMPLFVRISASDWSEGGWTIEDSVQLAEELKSLGVDLIDTSSGGNVPNAKITVGPGYQVPFAEQIKHGSTIVTSAVGMITDPHQANEIITSGKADAVMLAREMLRNPRWPLFAAHELGVEVNWPRQLARGKLS